MLRGVGAMADAGRRAEAARALAAQLGANDLIVFVHDESIGRPLPDGPAWRELTERAIAEGRATATIDGEPVRAAGLEDGTVAVLIGGTPREDALELLRPLLPLFGALLRMEAKARRAEAESYVARQATAQSSNELQRSLEVAETANRARDEFLATMSHELRTPLTSIIGWIQLLRAERDRALVAEGLDTIDRNARAQSRLIEDVLDFSRINAGKLRLEVRPIELVDVISSAIEVVRPAADAQGVKLDCVLDPNAGVVSADPDRLQQVVWNLLSNAVKFTPRDGRVQTRLERIGSFCELSVSDTGEGIAADFLPLVFDRFSQADAGSSRRHGGLGLGLGIVRHLVELHGGTVKAFSPGLGKGSTFIVRLPLLVAHHYDAPDVVKRAAAMPQRTPEHDELADLGGVSVLIVEDNDDARRMLAAILQRAGASVETAENAAAAMQLLARGRPDIIISDIEMPGEDGYSLIRRIRAGEPAEYRIPAVALTAYARGVDRVRALAAGFQMHMAKPVEPAELVAAVRSLVTNAGHRTAPS